MNTKAECKNQLLVQFTRFWAGLALATTLPLAHAAPGDLDLTFDPAAGPNWDVGALAVQGDGKLLIGGKFRSLDEVPCDCIGRLCADGSLDPSFHTSSFLNQIGDGPYVVAIALQAQGKILIGGSFAAINSVPRNCMARLNADGSLEGIEFRLFEGLTGLFQAGVLAMVIQPDGKILAGGVTVSDIGARPYLGRVNPDGSHDSSFTASLSVERGQLCSVHSLAVQSDGKILLGGFFTSVGGMARTNIARLNPNGSLDPSFLTTLAGFGVNQEVPVRGIAVQDDGKILIGGSFTSVNGVARVNLARLNPDGSLDNTFLNGLSGPSGTVTALALQTDGKILLGGWLPHVNGTPRQGIARLNADGSLDESFIAETRPSGVNRFAFQDDGKLLIGGGFTAVNQAPRKCVARLMGQYAAPGIVNELSSQTAEEGDTLYFSLETSGSPQLGYRWFFNDTNLLCCTTNCYIELTNVQFSHSGAYTVIITNEAGAVTSAPAMLNVISRVDRRSVPAINLAGTAGSLLSLDYASSLSSAPNWLPLDTVNLTSPAQFYFDLTVPLSPQRFYRAWRTGTPGVPPALNLHYVPAITLAGNIGNSVRVDCINQLGPTNACCLLYTSPSPRD